MKPKTLPGWLLVIGAIFPFVPVISFAADDAPLSSVAYARDVAPILMKNCVSCHRPGEMAPMSLLSYEETRPWAKSIKKAVTAREMPPWDADPAHGKFTNDASLKEKEIATIASWVDQGAPLGNPADLPPVPKFTEGWQLGEPDYVVELDEVDVPAEGPDLFPNLDAKINLPEDRWVRAVEVRPGDRTLLHHVVVFYVGGGGGAAGFLPDFLAVWAVGTPPAVYPETMGREVKKGSSLRVNMHYHPNGKAGKDKTRVGLYFGSGELKKVVSGQFAGTVAFAIPPGAEDHKLTARYLVDEDIDVVSLFPHMHMRGKKMKYTAQYPDGRSEILLNVPDYDFNWQWFYYPEKPLRLPKGTKLDIEAHYDNSDKNPNNPDPSITLTFGEESTDEMMFGAFEFIPVEGVKAKPPNLQAKVDAVLATYPADSAYKVNLSFGGFKLPTALHLPKEGAGMWSFPFGRQMLDIPLATVTWTGSAFEARTATIGRGSASMKGSIAEDGAITGTIDLGGLGAGSEGDPMRPSGFEGRRVAAAAPF